MGQSVEKIISIVENAHLLLFKEHATRSIPEIQIGTGSKTLCKQMPMQIEISAGRMEEMKGVRVIQDAIPHKIPTHGELAPPSFPSQNLDRPYCVFDLDKQIGVVHGTHAVVLVVGGRECNAFDNATWIPACANRWVTLPVT
jgi:hypothetical protein